VRSRVQRSRNVALAIFVQHRCALNAGTTVYEVRPADALPWPKMRTGNSSAAQRSANSASNVIPTRRDGSGKSHTNGQSTNASTAREAGTETNKMHQPTSASNEQYRSFAEGLVVAGLSA